MSPAAPAAPTAPAAPVPPIGTQSQPPVAPRPTFWTRLRATFLAGLVIFLPAAITVWVLSLLDSPFRRPFSAVADVLGPQTEIGRIFARLAALPGLGLVIGVVLILLIGVVARNYLGHHLIRLLDDLARRIPLIRAVYSSVKQLSDTVLAGTGRQSFRRAVLVRFPSEQSYAIGFVTGETRGAAQAATSETVVNVFVPTTPNPTSGFLLLLPAERLIPLDMSVENALKMVISGGIFVPADGLGAGGEKGTGSPPAVPSN